MSCIFVYGLNIFSECPDQKGDPGEPDRNTKRNIFGGKAVGVAWARREKFFSGSIKEGTFSRQGASSIRHNISNQQV